MWTDLLPFGMKGKVPGAPAAEKESSSPSGKQQEGKGSLFKAQNFCRGALCSQSVAN